MTSGQVPRIGIIGDGRVASHFAYYLQQLGVPYSQWSRRIEAAEGPSASAEALLGGRSLLFVLIKDAAIVPWIEAHGPRFPGARFVHFSGALVTPLAVGLHPLMSFGPELYPLDEYRRIAFVGEEGAPTLAELLPELPNPFHAIPAEQKPLYHALCVMSGNFTVLLWQKFFSELETRFGIPRSAGVAYLERVAANLGSNPGAALTGPIARRDHATLSANLRALEGDRFQSIYQSFVEAHS